MAFLLGERDFTDAEQRCAMQSKQARRCLVRQKKPTRSQSKRRASVFFHVFFGGVKKDGGFGGVVCSLTDCFLSLCVCVCVFFFGSWEFRKVMFVAFEQLETKCKPLVSWFVFWHWSWVFLFLGWGFPYLLQGGVIPSVVSHQAFSLSACLCASKSETQRPCVFLLMFFFVFSASWRKPEESAHNKRRSEANQRYVTHRGNRAIPFFSEYSNIGSPTSCITPNKGHSPFIGQKGDV